MRSVVVQFDAGVRGWRFQEVTHADSAPFAVALKAWRTSENDEPLCVVLDDLLLSWEQNHPMQTILFFTRKGSLEVVAKFVSGALDPTLCYLGAYVVAPTLRNRGLGTRCWSVFAAFVARSHPGVTRIALTPLERSKRFWKRHGFAALQTQTLGSVIKGALGDGPFAEAPLHGVEVWEWALVRKEMGKQ